MRRRIAGAAGTVQVRPQRVIGEQRLPHPRREFDGARRRVLPDALQDIDEVRVRVSSPGRREYASTADRPTSDSAPTPRSRRGSGCEADGDRNLTAPVLRAEMLNRDVILTFSRASAKFRGDRVRVSGQ